MPGVAVNGGRSGDILVELRSIDIDMHYPCAGSIALDIAGHTVVKPHAHGHDHIGPVGIPVGPDIAVHAHHTFVKPMGRGNG